MVQTTERVLFLERQLAQALANNRKLTDRVDLFENNSQLTNVEIDGKAEVAGEDLNAYVTAIVTALGTTIDDNDIDQIYRIGKKTGGNRKRPIMVKFTTVAKRNAVYFARNKLKGHRNFDSRPMYTNDDVNERTRRQRADI